MKSSLHQVCIFFFASLIIASCGSDGKTKGATTNQETKVENHKGHDHAGHDHEGHSHEGHDHGAVNTGNVKQVDGIISHARLDADIPGPCTLLPPDFVKEVLGLSQDVTLKEGTEPSPKTRARACFYKWEDPTFANSAILVQAMKDPLPEEGFVDWAFYYVDSKKATGEMSMDDPDNPVLFEPYNDLGDSGAASDAIKKYYWQVSKKVVFLIAYNMNATPEQMRKWNKVIGKKMMENYNK